MKGWDSTLDFGQYNGMEIDAIFALDADYLVWIRDNVERVQFSKDVLEALHNHELGIKQP